MGFELILELRTVFMNAIHACTSKTAYFWIHTDPFIENAGKLWNCLGSLARYHSSTVNNLFCIPLSNEKKDKIE